MTVNRALGCPCGVHGGAGAPSGEAETVNLVSSAGVGFSEVVCI